LVICGHVSAAPGKVRGSDQWSHTLVGWLAAEVGKLMANPATRDRLRAMSLELLPPSTPECFAAYIKTEIERRAVIVKNSNAGFE